MTERAWIAAWAALLVSVLTLVVLVAVAMRPEAESVDLGSIERDLAATAESIDALTSDLDRLRDSVGQDGPAGTATGLHASVADALRAASRAGDNAVNVAGQLDAVQSDLDSANAKLSDLCFRLDAC